MKMHLSLRGVKKKEGKPAGVPPPKSMMDEAIQATIAQPPGKGEGYIDDLKRMVKHGIARSRELAEKSSSIGMAALLAVLSQDAVDQQQAERITSYIMRCTAEEVWFWASKYLNVLGHKENPESVVSALKVLAR
jgi:hypothetical protein